MEQVLSRVKKEEMKNGFLGEFVFSNEKGRIHAIRRTLNSNLRCSGMSATVAASILGHTEKVNEENYTYDVSNMEYKAAIISGINQKVARM